MDFGGGDFMSSSSARRFAGPPSRHAAQNDDLNAHRGDPPDRFSRQGGGPTAGLGVPHVVTLHEAVALASNNKK